MPAGPFWSPPQQRPLPPNGLNVLPATNACIPGHRCATPFAAAAGSVGLRRGAPRVRWRSTAAAVIAGKGPGNAVARHRRQRQLRHALAGMWHELPGGSWVIRALPGDGDPVVDLRRAVQTHGRHWGFIWRLPSLLAIGLIRMYQKFISPMFGPSCKFHPTCSSYAVTSLQTHGLLKGSVLAVARLGRCHPWQLGGINPPPPAGKWRADVDLDGNPRGYHVHPRVAGNRRLVDPRHVPCRTHPIFGAASGAAWGLSIVGLVIVIRTLLIPLFVGRSRRSATFRSCSRR